MPKHAPKPASRPEHTGWFQRIKLFRQDMFSSQPDRLYRAWMAETRGPFYRSFLINDPKLVRRVLVGEPEKFPKSSIIHDTLRGLLGESVFLTNGEVWKRQRRIIDPAFEGSAKAGFPAMVAAGQDAVGRMPEGDVEIEYESSYLAADIIFRTLFSIPITSDIASRTFHAFRVYQRAQPLWNIPGLLRLPRWIPRLPSKASRTAASTIRQLLTELVEARAAAIADGNAPDDLATRIMTMADPETGQCFTPAEMVDQVAIFFLAGHETSASALAWGLYLLADNPDVQDRVAAEAAELPADPTFSDLSRLPYSRDVFREVLRLFPPVPMMVREASVPTKFRDRIVPKRSLAILSPWHLHRHERLWDRPDEFDPDRWRTESGEKSKRDAYIPFSAGPRVCTGAGFAMVEGILMLAVLVRAFQFESLEEPVPVAHLTVRAKNGIMLRLSRR